MTRLKFGAFLAPIHEPGINPTNALEKDLELMQHLDRLGFDEAAARTLAEGTFVGAGALLHATREDPAELRRRVTSPKGTTERAIAVLEDADLAELFERAAAAAVARARELAAGA